LRGFITFYGLHYISYFYSEKFDCWYQFNDEHISPVGCFKDVKKKCLAGRQRPTTVFYERSDIIMNVIEQEDAAHVRKWGSYFSEEAMMRNNFWLFGTSKRGSCG